MCLQHAVWVPAGAIDVEELQHALEVMGIEKSAADVQELMDSVDKDGSGEPIWTLNIKCTAACLDAVNVHVHACWLLGHWTAASASVSCLSQLSYKTSRRCLSRACEHVLAAMCRRVGV